MAVVEQQQAVLADQPSPALGLIYPLQDEMPRGGFLDRINLPRPQEKSVHLGGYVWIEFVLISAGSFSMGSEDGNDQRPVHTVTITKPFYMGKYEVTQGQWKAVMGNSPTLAKPAYRTATTRG